ncbi:MAG: ABC transporter permease [Alphaproteobacteria bacterium]
MSAEQAQAQAPTHSKEAEQRLKKTPWFIRMMRRPELGAVAGTIIIAMLFYIFADDSMFKASGIVNWLQPSAQLGILAVAAAMLMIGGEFDLSIGSMWGFSGCVLGVALVVWDMPLWAALLVAFAAACLIGAISGQIILKTGLPSFIVTLAFLFILAGLTLVFLKVSTAPKDLLPSWEVFFANPLSSTGEVFKTLFWKGGGGATQLRAIKEAVGDSWGDEFLMEMFSGTSMHFLFAWLHEWGMIDTFTRGKFVGQPKVTGIHVEVVWFIVLTVVLTFVLLKTKFGNWVFAAGGDPNAARNQGVPVKRVKIILFMLTAGAATLVAAITILSLGSADAIRGFQKEFFAIIAAVVGGCLLTGGYGSVICAAFGAIIYGMVFIGIGYTEINQDWFKVFLGGMLLLAVLFNNFIRKRVTGER